MRAHSTKGVGVVSGGRSRGKVAKRAKKAQAGPATERAALEKLASRYAERSRKATTPAQKAAADRGRQWVRKRRGELTAEQLGAGPSAGTLRRLGVRGTVGTGRAVPGNQLPPGSCVCSDCGAVVRVGPAPVKAPRATKKSGAQPATAQATTAAGPSESKRKKCGSAAARIEYGVCRSCQSRRNRAGRVRSVVLGGLPGLGKRA